MRITIGSRLENCARIGCAAVALLAVGCGSDPGAPSPDNGTTTLDLENRAYIVSRDSGEVFVLDLNTMEMAGSMETSGAMNHMAELNQDFTKGYIDSAGTNETIIFDARKLVITKRVKLGAEPTHLALSRDGKIMGIMNEGTNEVSFLDTTTDTEIKRLSGFNIPHFIRFSPDGQYGYVANIGSHHITRVELSSLTIDGHIVLDGFEGPPNATEAVDEGGFADAQIDQNGVLYAAHAETGKVLVYDTVAKQKKGEFAAGMKPWIVYAEHPFQGIKRHVVPNFGDETVSLIRPSEAVKAGTSMGADQESFGVNYSQLVPHLAFVMNRVRSDIAVVDTDQAKVVKSIPVGGNTETASTTADGRFIVAAVSSADRVVVIDTIKQEVIKTFERVGKYPWSVTIPRGQNYCH